MAPYQCIKNSKSMATSPPLTTMLLPTRASVITSIVLGASAGFIAHLIDRPVNQVAPFARVNVPAATRSAAVNHPARQLTEGESRKLSQMITDLGGNQFDAFMKRGARELFGGDLKKMRTANHMAKRIDHFNKLDLEVSHLRMCFKNEDSYDEKVKIYETIRLSVARNLQLIKVISERGDDLRRFDAEDAAGFGKEGAAKGAGSSHQPQAIPKLIQ